MGKNILPEDWFSMTLFPHQDIATLAYRIGTGELRHATGQTFHINSGSYLF